MNAVSPAGGVSKRWLIVAGVYAFINVGGLVYAAMEGEGGHALVHVVLLVAGAVFMAWKLRPGSARGQLSDDSLSGRQLDELQRSVDALAVSVERVGEAQRYTAKLAQEQAKLQRKPEE